MLDSTNAVRRRELVALLASRRVPTLKIAAQLGVPANVVRADRLALSLPSPEVVAAQEPPKKPEPMSMEQRREAVRELCKQDLYDREIAEKLGISSMTVVRDRKAMGIKPKKNPDLTEARRKEVARMVAEGIHQRDIAKALGVWRTTIIDDCNFLFGPPVPLADRAAENRKLVRKMVAEGKTVAEMASRLGVAQGSVRRYLKTIAEEDAAAQ